MSKILRVLFIVISTGVASYFLIAFGLILSQGPLDLSGEKSISFAGVAGQTQ